MPIRENSNVQMGIRTIESADATELYINASPVGDGQSDAEALAEIYGELARGLRAWGAQVLAERVIVNEGVSLDLVHSARQDMGLDRFPPTILCGGKEENHSISGVQVHAVVCESEIKPVVFNGQAIGRRLTQGDRTWAHFGAITASSSDSSHVQADVVYRQAAAVLASMNMSFHHVARTWVWLRDILNWYDDFNGARTGVFQDLGLVDGDGVVAYLPASTGIGLAPGDGAAVGLEFIAINDGDRSIRNFVSGGEQPSAFTYGSAFARAGVAPTPAGSTLFVSGTAAIDEQGHTEHTGNAEAQIDATIQHVRAILREANVRDRQVMSALAYAKTPEIALQFRDRYADLAWPRIQTIADVCRDDLLFEIELTASVGKQLTDQSG